MTKRRWPVIVLGAAAFSVVGASLPSWAASGTSGTQHFLGVQTSPSAKTFPVSATGPIHALGKDTPLSNNTDRFAFPKGNLAITHHKTSGSQHFDKANCTGRITEQGIFQVTGGTKSYANASGHGTYSLVGYFIGCSQNKPPQAMSIVIQAAGPIHLPG